MITAIAVDDEPKALELIQIHAGKVPFLELKDSFRDALKAIDWLQQNTVDLIFLDINMPNLSGLKFRSLIGEQTMIIFTTAYSEYAVESYNLNAVDYLLKPIPFERFLKAVLKAKEQLRLNHSPEVKPEPETPLSGKQIYVKSGTKLIRLEVADILYLEKDGNYVLFYTKERKVLSRLNMTQALEILPDKLFLRVHKSYIVALRHIDVVEQGHVEVNGKKIAVAKTYKDILLDRLKS